MGLIGVDCVECGGVWNKIFIVIFSMRDDMLIF